MGNDRWYDIKCYHRVADPELKWVKVAALNLFHPTASPLFQSAFFSYYDTTSWGRGIG